MKQFNPFALISYAQRSRLLRWFLGLRNFSLMPTRPGEDPVLRLQLRLITSLAGVLALLVTIIAAAAAGIAAMVATSARPAAWILLFGGGIPQIIVGRSFYQCRTNKMPSPGVLLIGTVLNLAAIVTGGWMLNR